MDFSGSYLAEQRLAGVRCVGLTSSATLEVDLGRVCEFNVVRTEEMIALGQRVQAYRIEIPDGVGWKAIAQGTTIGYRRLDRFLPVKAAKVRLVITQARASPAIRVFGVHFDPVSPPEHFTPEFANAEAKKGVRAPRPKK